MLSPGTSIGPFEVLSRLGAGGMGEVYRARDTRLRREIAIKVLPAAFAADTSRLRRFELEARATGMLNHPNILTVYEVGVDGGQPYLATELLQGQTLYERLSRDPIPLRKALDYAQQIARGLATAHEHGIVHRDLKPENLFVSRDGNVKILDFGLAKLAAGPSDGETTQETITFAGQVLGTAAYMSPEQVRGHTVDHRSDIFSFGLVLYEMISGRRPFQAASVAEVMAQIATQDAPPLDAPPGVDSVIRRCLEKEPEERFQSAHDLGFALQSLALQVQSASGTGGPAIPTPSRHRTRWTVLAAALALAAGVFGAGYSLGKRPKPPPVFHQITYRRGTVYTARFAHDGQTVVYGARWDARPIDTFAVRREYPESRSLGLDADLLAVSRTDELALLREPRYLKHYQWSGTLAVSPLGGGSPRDLLDQVVEADYAGDGRLAVATQEGGRYRVEFPAGKVLYETPAWITHLRVGPKGDRVAFLEHRIPNDDQGSVVMVEASGKKTVLSEGWTGAAEGLAWNAARDEVWFSASQAGEASLAIYAVSLSGRIRKVLGGPQAMVLQDIDPEGRVLMASQIYRTEVRVAGGPRQERDLSWLEGSNFPFLSADGQTLLFSEEAAPSGYTVCLRRTDGSPVVQLGRGTPSGFSPDGKWALVLDTSTPRQLMLLPTGAGRARELPRGAIESFGQSGWFPDGKRILFVGSERGKGRRAYRQEVFGGLPQPVLPEGVQPAPRVISPDGRSVPCRNPGPAGIGQEWMICDLEGAAPRPLPGLPKTEIPIKWTPDGKSLYTYIPNALPWRVMKVSVNDGRRESWKEVIPSDPVGLDWLLGVDITPSGESMGYAFLRQINGLYIAEGLQ